MDALHLDGNGVAGLLAELFGTEMSDALRACDSCGTHAPLGAHRAYHGAGVVLRCPTCGDVALRVALAADRHVVRLEGAWSIPRAPET